MVTFLHLKTIMIVSLYKVVISTSNRRKGLSMDDFNTILSTGIDEEFGATIPNDHSTKQTAEALWDEVTSHEWDIAFRKEQQHQTKNDDNRFPYIVCCNQKGGQSGHECKSKIESSMGYDLLNVYNRNDKTCFVSYVSASVANDAPDFLSVQPLSSHMKIGDGTIQGIEGKSSPPSKFVAFLCPGAVSSKELAEELGHSIVDSMRNRTTTSTKGTTIVSETFLRANRRMTNTTSNTDHTQTAGAATNSNRSGWPSHDRARLWQSAFQTGLDAEHQCNEMFAHLNVTGTRNGESFVLDVGGSGGGGSHHHHATRHLAVSKSCLLSLVSGLATRNEVCLVGVIPDYGGFNVQAQWIVQSNVEESRPWFDAGLTGKRQVIAVSDTGIDTDNCYFWDGTGDIRKNGVLDHSRRKVVQYVPYADKYDDVQGHGTHVAATVVGRRARKGHRESTGEADGIARDSKVAFIDIGVQGQTTYSVPTDIDELFQPGKRAGASIHSISWGSSFDGYDTMARDIDETIYEDETFLVIAAAGNNGNLHGPDSMNTVVSPATSKNVISVGACQSEGPDLAKGMLGRDYLADFSSRGPTRDGRTKPEIVAPGFFLLSASADPTTVGECDDTDGIRFDAGTSMAAPVVSGAAALIRQYFEDGWYPGGYAHASESMVPSGTLVKAVLLNGAIYLKGVQNNDNITDVVPYDNHQNFGRISLINSLPLKGTNHLQIIVKDRKIINDGDVDKITLYADSSSSGGCNSSAVLSATLVWADPPGVPFCKQCVLNHLALTVKTKDAELFPNGLNGTDEVNNAQRVRLDNVNDNEKIVVKVKATDLVTLHQTYSLVVVGCFRENRPAPPVSAIPSLSPATKAPIVSPTTKAPIVSPTKAPLASPVPSNSPTNHDEHDDIFDDGVSTDDDNFRTDDMPLPNRI